MYTGPRAGVHNQGNKAYVSVPLGTWASMFQVEVYAVDLCSRMAMKAKSPNEAD